MSFQAVFWHSSAHVLGEAMERVYGGHLCYGPPIENGFYYDMYSPDRNVSHHKFLKDPGTDIYVVRKTLEGTNLWLAVVAAIRFFVTFGVAIRNEK